MKLPNPENGTLDQLVKVHEALKEARVQGKPLFAPEGLAAVEVQPLPECEKFTPTKSGQRCETCRIRKSEHK